MRSWLNASTAWASRSCISLRHDTVLLFLIVYSFTYAVFGPAKGARMELVERLGRRRRRGPLGAIAAHRDALLPPYSSAAGQLVGRARSTPRWTPDRYTFVIDIPPDFQADVLAGRSADHPGQRGCHRDESGRARRRLHRRASSRRRSDVPAQARSRSPRRGGAGDAREVQPQPDVDLVRRGDADRQQHHHAGHHPVRRGAGARARARHDRAPAGDAAHARRDHAGEGLGQRARHRSRRHAVPAPGRAGALGVPIAGSMPLFMFGTLDLHVLGRPRSASSSPPWPARCRSSACWPSWCSSS